MVRFLVLYGTPADPEGFDRHYCEVHVPLAKRIAGLRAYTLSRNAAPVRGGDPYYLVSALDWDDLDSLRRAFDSPEGMQAASDVEDLARFGPTIHSMIFELEDA